MALRGHSTYAKHGLWSGGTSISRIASMFQRAAYAFITSPRVGRGDESASTLRTSCGIMTTV